MKSPYNLLQEIYYPDAWKIFVCCIFLNQTTRAQVDAIRREFFRRWPTPYKAAHADVAEMSHLIKSLGLSNKRSRTIVRMSHEFLKGWKSPKDLYGLGQYANDSYEIFMRKNYNIKHPADKFLNKYIEWVKR